MRILGSARKHGVSDEDIMHALAHPIRLPTNLDHDKVRRLGATSDGTPLELIVIDDEDPRVIHAMRARAKFWP